MTQINFNNATGLNIKQGVTTAEKYLIVKQGGVSKLVWADPNIYLEATESHKYINTGFVPNILCRYDFAYSTSSSSLSALFGQRTSGAWNTSTDQIYHNPMATSTTQKFFYGTSSYTHECAVNQKYALSYTDARTGYAGAEQPIYLFAFNLQGSVSSYFVGKFYYLNIYNSNNELIHQYVPVPSGMVIGNTTISSNGMFDIVTQTPLYNSGLGSFNIGQDQPTRGKKGGSVVYLDESNSKYEEVKEEGAQR